jgi:RimJ/RimL family protein N-acetyltransferase
VHSKTHIGAVFSVPFDYENKYPNPNLTELLQNLISKLFLLKHPLYAEMESFIEEALQKKEVGTEVPFVVLHSENNKVIGSSRFLEISNTNKSLEIGWSWSTHMFWELKSMQNVIIYY